MKRAQKTSASAALSRCFMGILMIARMRSGHARQAVGQPAQKCVIILLREKVTAKVSKLLAITFRLSTGLFLVRVRIRFAAFFFERVAERTSPFLFSLSGEFFEPGRVIAYLITLALRNLLEFSLWATMLILCATQQCNSLRLL
jgi:hypothetical protein